MRSSYEQIQVFYEISLSIGQGKDLEEMAKKSLVMYLRKLNFSAGAIYRIDPDADRCDEMICSVPRNVLQNKQLVCLLERLFVIPPCEMEKSFLSDLPLSGKLGDELYYYIMDLPGFGVLILLKKGSPLQEGLIKKLDPLNGKLAAALKAKLMEARLQESEQRFRDMADLLPQSLWECDTQGRLTYVNQAFFSVSGYTPEDFEKGIHVMDILVPEERPRAMMNLKERMGGKTLQDHEYTCMRKDGKYVYAVVFSAPIIKNGAYEGLRGLSLDISDIKKAEQELLQAKMEAEQANRIKTQFLAKMSHELRTPLNSIIGFSDVLGMNMSGNLADKELHYSRNIFKSGKHLLGVINDILDISRIETDNMEMNITEFDVASVINEVADNLHLIIKEQNIDVRLNLPSVPLELNADKTKIREILYNLLSNSIKFNHEGGTVWINCDAASSGVKISVSDTGIGIPLEYQQEIFDSFKQLDDFYNRKHGGTGLGLFLVKQYVEMHMGTIQVSSEEGVGSTFTFCIPDQLKKLNEKDMSGQV